MILTYNAHVHSKNQVHDKKATKFLAGPVPVGQIEGIIGMSIHENRDTNPSGNNYSTHGTDCNHTAGASIAYLFVVQKGGDEDSADSLHQCKKNRVQGPGSDVEV